MWYQMSILDTLLIRKEFRTLLTKEIEDRGSCMSAPDLLNLINELGGGGGKG